MEHIRAGDATRLNPPLDDAAELAHKGDHPPISPLPEVLFQRLMVTSANETIDVADLPQALLPLTDPQLQSSPDGMPTLHAVLSSVESQLARAALARYKTQALAAKHLGITQSTVARKAKQYGLESPAS